MATQTTRKGFGWVTFAAIMILLAGAFNVMDGIVALTRSTFYVAGATYAVGSLQTWGWVVLILGIVQLFAGGAILNGRAWGRWFGIIAAGLNAIGQMLFIPSYPFWSLTIIAVDLLIIYGLAAYGGRQEAY